MENAIYKPDEDRIHELFKTVDTHNDGYITLEELETYLSQSGQHFTKADIKSFIRAGDVISRDGVLDFTEFMNFMTKHETQLWKHFKLLDRDGSGQISNSELSYYCKQHGLDMPGKTLTELISRLDKDGNLQISWDEFREFNQFRVQFKISSRHYYGDPYADGIVKIPTKKKSFGHIEKLVCGGVAGVVSRTMTAPLDRVKVLLQVQGQQRVLGSSKDLDIKGLFQAMSREGYFSMWRGNGISCIKIFPENAIRFLLFEYLCNSKRINFSQNGFVNKLISGGLTGIAVQSLMYPVEVIKTRVMTGHKTQNVLGTIRNIAQENGRTVGLTNFYKGYPPAIVGIVPFAALQLGLSKAGTEMWSEWNEIANPGFWPLLSISSASTLVAMAATYPLQLTKCQMQAYEGPTNGRPSFKTLASKIWRTEGASGFYRGFSANAMKAIPASAIGWTVFNKTQQLYEKYVI